MIISIDREKVFDTIQYPFMIKTLNKLVIEENFFNVMKDNCEKPTGNMLMVKN